MNDEQPTTPEPAKATPDDNDFRPQDKFSFSPEAPERTILLGLAKWDRNDQGRYIFKFLWKRVFLTFCILGIFGWLALSTAAWAFVTYNRKVEDVSFFDIVLPFRWHEYQRKRGNAYVEQAKVATREQRFREAFQMLRVGVAKSPANLEGRLELARYYQAIGRLDLAMDVVETGLEYAEDDTDYLGTYIQLLLANREDDRARKLAAERLPQAQPGSKTAQVLAFGAATANFMRGDYDAAEDLLGRHGLAQTGDGRLLEAQIEWDRGHQDLALMRLRALINEHPTADQPYAVMFDFLRKLGRTSEASSLAVERAVANPDSVAAEGALLYGYAESGNDTRLAREVDRLGGRIAAEPQAFFVLAEFAINTGDVVLADRVRELAAETEIDPGMAAIVTIEARVAAGEYTDALARIETLNKEKPEWLAAQSASIAALRAVAEFGSGDHRTGDLMLDYFLAQTTTHTNSLLALSNQLRKTGVPGAARRVLAHAVSLDPQNQAVLTNLIELDLEDDRRDDLAAHATQLITMRKPSVNLLERIHRALGSDRLLFSQERADALALLADAIAERGDASTSRRARGQ